MGMSHPNRFRPLGMLGLLGLAVHGMASLATAQNLGPDPYKPYNSVYDQYVYPTYPSSLGFSPNQGILEGRSGGGGANQFQNYIGGLMDEDADDPLVRTTPGRPYYQAYRRYDEAYGRLYRPNQEADKGYREEKEARLNKYLDYLKERDPARRAELFRQYTTESRRFSRELSSPRGFGESGGYARTEDGKRPPSILDRNPRPTPGRGPSTSRPSTPSERSNGVLDMSSPSSILRRSQSGSVRRPARSGLYSQGTSPRRSSTTPRPSSLLPSSGDRGPAGSSVRPDSSGGTPSPSSLFRSRRSPSSLLSPSGDTPSGSSRYRRRSSGAPTLERPSSLLPR